MKEDSYQLTETAGAGGADYLYCRPSPGGDVCVLIDRFLNKLTANPAHLYMSAAKITTGIN